MRLILIFLLLDISIFLYEAYWPITDPSLDQYKVYSKRAKLYEEKLGIPVSVSVFFKINSAEEAKKLVSKYRNCQFKSEKIWIDRITPRLNNYEKKQILKFNLIEKKCQQ